MKVICKYIVFMLFIYNFNIFNIDAEKPFSGTLNKVYVCMYVCKWDNWPWKTHWLQAHAPNTQDASWSTCKRVPFYWLFCFIVLFALGIPVPLSVLGIIWTSVVMLNKSTNYSNHAGTWALLLWFLSSTSLPASSDDLLHRWDKSTTSAICGDHALCDNFTYSSDACRATLISLLILSKRFKQEHPVLVNFFYLIPCHKKHIRSECMKVVVFVCVPPNLPSVHHIHWLCSCIVYDLAPVVQRVDSTIYGIE